MASRIRWTLAQGRGGSARVEAMREGLEQLRFQPTEEPLAAVFPLAVGGSQGAPVVRNLGYRR